MTDSAAITRGSQEYRNALQASAQATSEDIGAGFVDPAAVGQKALTAIIRQCNFLVQITVTINRKLTELEDRVKALEDQSRRIELGKSSTVQLTPDLSKELVEEVKKLGLAPTASRKGKEKAPFYVQQGKNPYKQLEDARKKP